MSAQVALQALVEAFTRIVAPRCGFQNRALSASKPVNSDAALLARGSLPIDPDQGTVLVLERLKAAPPMACHATGDPPNSGV